MKPEDARILAAKLALEIELVKPLAYVLSAYLGTWARNEGYMPIWDQTGHRNMIERVLLRHYARTVSVMSGQVPTSETNIDSVALGPAHAASLRQRAHNQTLHMVRGMDRDLATILATMPEPPMPPPDLTGKGGSEIETKKTAWSVQYAARFKETARQAWHKLKGRLKAMVNLETEAVSEQYQVEWVRQKHANSRIYKTWHNPMDGRERAWHHQAHLDYSETGIPVDQPFIVGGEELMQPGDSSRGASLANLINCRCHSAYHIVGPNGERLDIPLQTPALPAKRTWHPGDRFGREIPVRPTESITMTGRTRARVVLGDGRTFATMQQTAPDTVVIRVNGRDVARATFGNGVVSSITTAPGNEHLDLEGLIRRSVAATNTLLMRRP